NQNGPPHAGFPHLHAFVRARHAEPVRTRFLEYPRHLRPAVPVGIAFHDREDLAGRFAPFIRRVHIPANGMEIFRQRGNRNLRPYRTAFHFCWEFRCVRHDPFGPRKGFSVRQSRAALRSPRKMARVPGARMTTAWKQSAGRKPPYPPNPKSEGPRARNRRPSLNLRSSEQTCARAVSPWFVAPHPHRGSSYISLGPSCEKASGAASSKRVNRLRKTNLTLSTGPLRCLAIFNSVSSRSSGVAPCLKKCGR